LKVAACTGVLCLLVNCSCVSAHCKIYNNNFGATTILGIENGFDAGLARSHETTVCIGFLLFDDDR